ncbi:MAG: hypothetical protein J6R88_05195 [Clostridia bacterium]|nr:hypothetical protein [Clostridia bacterium]
MAKNNQGFVVPEELRHEYKMMVQRANRRVKSNLKLIAKDTIPSEHTQRALVGSFNDPMNWSSRTMPFSRSIKGRYITNADTGFTEFKEFKTKTEFDQYMKYLSKWGAKTEKGELYSAHPQKIKEDYKTAILKSLNQVKDHYNITLPNGQIPKEIIDDIDNMTLQEITNFFGNGDPSEDVEISQFSSDDFLDVENAQDFIDVVKSRIAMIKRFN